MALTEAKESKMKYRGSKSIRLIDVFEILLAFFVVILVMVAASAIMIGAAILVGFIGLG